MQALKTDLQSKQSLMIEQLKSLCLINSGTGNLPGNANMLEALQALFSPLADECKRIPMPQQDQINMQGDTKALQCGDALFIRKRPHLSRRILLTGHMDTV